MKIFAALVIALSTTGCITIEEQMAKRTGCDKTGVTVVNSSNSPVHTNWVVKCSKENKEYVCTDTAFSRTCKEKKEAEKS